MCEINADPQVMEYFHAIQDAQQTSEFVARMQKQFSDKGFCYFAVDKLETTEFIGFIGLSEQTFEADFTPCIDLGWRLAQKEWGKGLATEGATRCLSYAFDVLGLYKVYALCPAVNVRSVAVMQKIGMQKVQTFDHPILKDHETLRLCVLYRIEKEARAPGKRE